MQMNREQMKPLCETTNEHNNLTFRMPPITGMLHQKNTLHYCNEEIANTTTATERTRGAVRIAKRSTTTWQGNHGFTTHSNKNDFFDNIMKYLIHAKIYHDVKLQAVVKMQQVRKQLKTLQNRWIMFLELEYNVFIRILIKRCSSGLLSTCPLWTCR